MHRLTEPRAAHFASIALGHVTRAYPHKADHVMDDDGDVYRPADVHPVFYGSFDWHSCVHGYWLLARLRRLFPGLDAAPAIDRLFDDHLTADKLERERAYLDRASARSFERPYGWAWLLMLAAELERAGSRHAAALRPLATAFAARFHAYLPVLTYPVRAGTHANSAFALVLAARYARTVADEALLTLLAQRARTWFGGDRVRQVWEPSGEDFLSPVLTEAVAMATLLPAAEAKDWLSRFLPDLAAGEPAALLSPVTVSDRSDGRIAHLDGLNLSRAWAWRVIAPLLPAASRDVALAASERHLDAALGEVAGDYMGEHWLASFALLALTVE
ncbi:DUF2891 domain-containing protein [Sphingomonas sp.]|uniref:DUF2891 domain-containing protein n=1 Tax=Sphingomonas sp. TaxID=28214 RepID=UPI0035C842E5